MNCTSAAAVTPGSTGATTCATTRRLCSNLTAPETMKSAVRSPAFRRKRLASRNGSASEACGLKAGLRTDFPQENHYYYEIYRGAFDDNPIQLRRLSRASR